MNQSRVAILGLVLGLCSITASSSVVRAQTAATPHIGVVNLQQVYRTMQETADTMNEMKGMQGELDTSQKSHQGQLQEQQQKIANTAKPDSSQYAEMMTDFDAMNVKFASEEKVLQLKMARKQGKQLTQAFAEIQAAVNDIAKKKGLDVVIVSTANDLPPGAQNTDNLQNLATAIFSRNTLFVSDKVDLTAEVVTALDAQYKSRGSTPGK